MRVFMDSSALFAAIHSPSGGAGAIIERARQEELTICVTEKILEESIRHIKSKIGAIGLIKLVEILFLPHVERIDAPSSEEEAKWINVTADKDCHVLAGALKAKADRLITHDKKQILTDQVKKMFPIPAMTPGDFLREWVTQ